MSEQTLTIAKSNGQEFFMSSNNDIKVLMFLPSSPIFNAQYEKIPGRHGDIDLPGGSFEAQDNIKSRIFFRSRDIYDFYLFRDEIFRLFASQEPFYITTNREPGKRWKVRVASRYEIEPKGNGSYGVFDITFKSASPFCESIGTTLDSFTFDSELWQIGQGLMAEDTKYIHNTTSFRIYNAGNVTIDPKSMGLKIKYKGKSNNLSIKNVTTGDLWSYAGVTTTERDVITLDGVKAYRNVLGSIFKNTNWGLITLNPGWNDFVLTGATGDFKIEFDFRFYYFS
ncbi:phage tail family protein [Bacillus cereus group sp. Sample62]|uniref:phage tail family protein n=1 Tax=unclassified Bacillus cereus group TaxID=2750818 RepID=UPI001F586A25|nr:phage tail family protein [Bacillus cereus group sp. BfR-BA-01324]